MPVAVWRMGIWSLTSPPCIYNHTATHPIEFNITTAKQPVHNAYLSLFIEDIDWPAEVDEVYLNGHSLGFAIGQNNLNYSTLFVIPDLTWVRQGDNLVQVFVDQDNTGWCAKARSGQLILDEDNGKTGTAKIRTAAVDRAEYDYGRPLRWTWKWIPASPPSPRAWR